MQGATSAKPADSDSLCLTGLAAGVPAGAQSRATHHVPTTLFPPCSSSSPWKLEGWELREEQSAETTQTLLIVFTEGQTPRCTRVGWPGLARPFHFQDHGIYQTCLGKDLHCV